MTKTTMEVDADLRQLASARSGIVARVAAWDVPVDRGVLALLVSELVANAVEHGLPPIVASVEWDGSRVRVEVSDSSPELPIHHQPAPSDAGGRGIWLVDHSASAWGIERTARGKTVWFELRSAFDPAV